MSQWVASDLSGTFASYRSITSPVSAHCCHLRSLPHQSHSTVSPHDQRSPCFTELRDLLFVIHTLSVPRGFSVNPGFLFLLVSFRQRWNCFFIKASQCKGHGYIGHVKPRWTRQVTRPAGPLILREPIRCYW